MMKRWQAVAALGAGLGFAAVVIGALGRHAFAGLPAQQASAVDIAQRYQLVHAVVLLVVAVWMRQSGTPQPALRWAAICLTLGTLVFCGSIYLLVAGAPRWLGPITPVGGVLLMAGWLSLVWAGVRGGNEK